MGPGYDPMVDADSALECLMQQLPLAGAAYDADNAHVFKMLQQATITTTAYVWIEPHISAMDARTAMLALRAHFEGPSHMSKKGADARTTIQNMRWTSENHEKFESMITRLKKAYNIQERMGQVYLEETKVQHLYGVIQVANNSQLGYAKEAMMTQYRHNFDLACTHMSTRISEIFPPSAARGGSRRISEGNSAKEINGISLANPTRDISQEDWAKLGTRGQDLIRQARARARSRGGRGRGGRGYQRGGRYGGRGYNNYGRGGRHGRGYGRGGRGGRGNYNNWNNNRNGYQNNNGGGNDNNNRNINETNSNGGGPNNNIQRPDQPTSNGGQGNDNSSSNQGNNGNENGNNNYDNGNRGGRQGARFGRGRY